MEMAVLGREYDAWTLRSRKEAGEGVSSDTVKGTDGASYSSVFVFVVVLCRGYSWVRSARAILQQLRQHNFRDSENNDDGSGEGGGRYR